MKRSLILLLALSSVAAFGAASDTFESRLTPYNQAVMTGDFYGIFGHHAALREFDKDRAYGANQQNVTLLKCIIDAKPSDHFLSNTLELFEPNSSVHQIIQAQDWQRLREEIDNIEQAQASTQTQHLTEEANMHAVIPLVSHAQISEGNSEKLSPISAAMLAANRTKNFAQQITWGEWNINTLANKCRALLAQDSERVLATLPMLHTNDNYTRDRFLLPALCINNALIKRIGMQTQILRSPFGLETIAFSPDGNTIAAGSYDNTVRLWNAHTGCEIRILQGHTHRTTSVAFSPDGNTLASGSYDNTVRLWDAHTGNVIRILQEHTNGITSLTFSPDGNTLASASHDRTVRLWDAHTGCEIRILQGHTNGITSVTFSPNGNTLASGSHDTTVRLWNAHTGCEIHILQRDIYGIKTVAFSPDGNTLVSGSYDRTVRLWNAHTGCEMNTLLPTSGIYSVAFSPDGKTLACGLHDGTVCLWNAQTGLATSTLEGHAAWVNQAAFSPDGNMLASVSHDCTVRLRKQYTQELCTIINQQEQLFLLNAIRDWNKNQAHVVTPKNKALHELLIKRFEFLNNSQLFIEADDSTRCCIIL